MMKYKSIGLFVLLFLLISDVGFSQHNTIKIRFIGNCGLYLTDYVNNIYVDFPYKSGAYGYMKYKESELEQIKENPVFIFTHGHADHYSKRNLSRIKKKHEIRVLRNANVKKIAELNSNLNDFKIEVIRTKHRFAFRHFSYIITWHGKKIYLSGDTENADVIGQVKGIDMAFVPYWIMLDAQDKNMKIDAKKFMIYHLYPNQKIDNSQPDRVQIIDEQGKIIELMY